MKSLIDMTEYFRHIDQVLKRQPMPVEYQQYVNLILCNDCEVRSLANYHFLYHKCQQCQGYNTKVLQTMARSSLKPEDLLALDAAQNAAMAGDTTTEPMAGAWPSEEPVPTDDTTARTEGFVDEVEVFTDDDDEDFDGIEGEEDSDEESFVYVHDNSASTTSSSTSSSRRRRRSNEHTEVDGNL